MFLDRTITELSHSSTTASFAKYFVVHYAYKKEQWAACYRKDAFNMYVEAFHRVLKYVYMKGRINKRLDKCLHLLIKLARDKGFERLVKMEKGKNTDRINAIRIRHQSSLKLPLSLIHQQVSTLNTNISTWEVHSSDTQQTYIVSLEHNNCPYNCSLRCLDCNICIHTFLCNCADALIRSTICKHIHLVARFRTMDASIIPNETEANDNIPHPESTLEDERSKNEKSLVIALQDTDHLTDIAMLKKDVQTALLTLAGNIRTVEDVHTLREVRAYITSALNFIRAHNATSKSLLYSKKGPPAHQPATKRV